MIGFYAVGFACFFMFMPKYIDDYWYMMYLRPWFESQGIIDPENGGNIFRPGIPFDAILETWQFHFSKDNARLGNLLAPIILMFPKWVGSGIISVVWLYSTIGVFRLSQTNMRDILPVGFGLLMLYFFMPWQLMGALDYQLNYVASTALAVWLLIMIRNRRDCREGWLKVLCIAVLTGLWHEGIAVVLFCGLMALIAADRRYRNLSTVIAAVSLAAGVILLLSVPGMRLRMSYSLTLAGVITDLNAIAGISMQSFAFILMQALVLAVTVSGKRSVIWQDAWFLMLEVCSLAGFALMLSANVTGRVSWPCSFFSIVGILYVLNSVIGGKCLRVGKWGLIALIPSMCLMYISMACVACISLQMRTEMGRMVRHAFAYAPEEDKAYFGRYFSLATLPAFCFSMPDRLFSYESPRYVYDYYTADYTGRKITVIPDCLRYVNAGSGVRIAGGSLVRAVNGFLYVPADSLPAWNRDAKLWMLADYGKGFVRVPLHVDRFVSDADGLQYVFIMPDVNWYVAHFKDIIRIKTVPSEYYRLQKPDYE